MLLRALDERVRVGRGIGRDGPTEQVHRGEPIPRCLPGRACDQQHPSLYLALGFPSRPVLRRDGQRDLALAVLLAAASRDSAGGVSARMTGMTPDQVGGAREPFRTGA